jgi:hypothetical protein
MSDRLPGISYDNPIWYRGYRIMTGPAYTRDSLWEFSHEDFDGAPTNYGEGPADQRYGMRATLAECREAIDDLEEALAAGSRRAKTPKAVECEASQSGPKGNAQ